MNKWVVIGLLIVSMIFDLIGYQLYQAISIPAAHFVTLIGAIIKCFFYFYLYYFVKYLKKGNIYLLPIVLLIVSILLFQVFNWLKTDPDFINYQWFYSIPSVLILIGMVTLIIQLFKNNCKQPARSNLKILALAYIGSGVGTGILPPIIYMFVEIDLSYIISIIQLAPSIAMINLFFNDKDDLDQEELNIDLFGEKEEIN